MTMLDDLPSHANFLYVFAEFHVSSLFPIAASKRINYVQEWRPIAQDFLVNTLLENTERPFEVDE